MRRHRVALVLGALWLVTIALLPSVPTRIVADRGPSLPRAGDVAADDIGAVVPTTPANTAATSVNSGHGGGVASAKASAPTAGTTSDCRALAEPAPSVYFPACVPAWLGTNGGATAPGVSGTTIRVADYWSLESGGGTGAASGDDYRAVRDAFVARFNQLFQLYGRKVEFVDFYAQHKDDTGDGACIDAARLENDLHPFAILSTPPNFAKCSAQRRIVNLVSSDEQPESFYAQHHPYIWGQVMECERTGHQLAEYLGKRVAHRNARWAGDAPLRTQTRKLALYTPDDDVYGPCIRIAESELKRDYGDSFVSTFRYGITAERLADQATRAVLQFKAAGATSVVLAADPLSIAFLTRAATANDWYPEWIVTGVAGNAGDLAGRDYDPKQVDGHMFGRASNIEQAKLWGRDGEPARYYQRISNKPLPGKTAGCFYCLLDLFTRLQGAGPRLSADSLAAASFAMPTMGSETTPFGIVSHQTRPDGKPGVDHTREDTAREVYWDAHRTAYDGEKGTFVSTMGGRFIRQGAWPVGEPAVYPDR